jgi:hypothetical protein
MRVPPTPLVFRGSFRPTCAVRDETYAHHQRVAVLGEAMGFDVVREWSPPSIEREYAPRIDVLWGRSLSRAQLLALEEMGMDVPAGASLPIAAWEIEGSDASTKGMGADLANLRVTRAPFGFLAARGDTKNNLYERALCIAKTQRHYFGCQAAVPLDANWIPDLAQLSVSKELLPLSIKQARGGGGEASWADGVRAALRQRGTKAGFGVADSFRSLLPSDAGFTRHEIDLVWTLPMPKGLRQFINAIGERDDRLLEERLIIAERYEHVVVAAFEIENSAGKHGFGGLLTLASHGVAGVFVAGDAPAAKKASAALATYRRFMGLSNVTVFDGLIR